MRWRGSLLAVFAAVAACRATPAGSDRPAAQTPTHPDTTSATPAPAPHPPASSTPVTPVVPTASPRDTSLTIGISLPATQIELGSPLPLRVEFKNEGATATTFKEPPRTWELALLAFGAEGPEATPAMPFGKMFYETHGQLARRTLEEAADISLEPGAVHSFVEDVGTRWPQLFPPGVRQLQVIDRRHTMVMRSNVVTVQVVFAEASLPKLFEVVERPLSQTEAWRGQSSEDGRIHEARQYAARWIAEFQPGFEFDPEEQPSRAAVARARALWEQQRGTPEVRAKIEAINRSAAQGAK